MSDPDAEGDILVLRALGLGDFLTAVPALRALRCARPAATLTLATRPEWAPLAALCGAVDRVRPTFGLSTLQTSARPVRLAVNLHGRGPQSHRDLLRSRADTVWAFWHPEVAHVPGPSWEPAEHEVQRWCRLLAWHGVAADPTDLQLRRPDLASRAPGAVVIHPGASARARQWPPASYAAIAAALHREGHQVVITGDRSERRLAEDVAAAAGLPTDAVLAGESGVLELATLIADAALLVCGDTGVAHLASAYVTPSVIIFGPVSPLLWGPPVDGPHTVIWSGVSGDTHADRADLALTRIPVTRVLKAAREQIRESVVAEVKGILP